MGGLSGQQARPGHSQTILKSLLSPLGGWEAHKPGSEFILSTWSLGLGGPGQIGWRSSQGACEPTPEPGLAQLPRTVLHQICHDVKSELNKGFPLGSEYWQLCVSAHQKPTPGRARSVALRLLPAGLAFGKCPVKGQHRGCSGRLPSRPLW